MNSYMRQASNPADQVQNSGFLADKSAWVNACSMYQGPDPLDHWYNYICWYENHIHRDPENKYREALEQCLTTFEHSDYYKQDPRMIRLWVKYIGMQPNPLHFYQVLYQRSVGRQVAFFFISWAKYYESINAFKEAEAVYNLGFREKAQPYAELQHAHSKFQFLKMHGTVATNGSPVPGTNEQVLAATHQHSKPMPNVSTHQQPHQVMYQQQQQQQQQQQPQQNQQHEYVNHHGDVNYCRQPHVDVHHQQTSSNSPHQVQTYREQSQVYYHQEQQIAIQQQAQTQVQHHHQQQQQATVYQVQQAAAQQHINTNGYSQNHIYQHQQQQQQQQAFQQMHQQPAVAHELQKQNETPAYSSPPANVNTHNHNHVVNNVNHVANVALPNGTSSQRTQATIANVEAKPHQHMQSFQLQQQQQQQQQHQQQHQQPAAPAVSQPVQNTTAPTTSDLPVNNNIANQSTLPPIKLPKKFASYSYNNHETWKPALFLEEPPDPCRRCCYAKERVYPGGDIEFSPEELHAEKYKDRLSKSALETTNNTIQAQNRLQQHHHHHPSHPEPNVVTIECAPHHQQSVYTTAAQQQQVVVVQQPVQMQQQQQEQHIQQQPQQHQLHQQQQVISLQQYTEAQQTEQLQQQTYHQMYSYCDQRQQQQQEQQQQLQQHQQQLAYNNNNSNSYNHYAVNQEVQSYNNNYNNETYESVGENGGGGDDEDDEDNDDDEKYEGDGYDEENENYENARNEQNRAAQNDSATTLDDLEEQIQASTIRFTMHSVPQNSADGNAQNSSLKIKFKKETIRKGQKNNKINEQYSSYSVETKSAESPQVRKNGHNHSFHPYLVANASTPKSSVKQPRQRQRGKTKKSNQNFNFTNGGGAEDSSDSSFFDNGNDAAYNNKNHQSLQNTFNDNANYSFSSATALENSNCSLTSAVDRLNVRDTTANSTTIGAADFSTYQENSYFATQYDTEAKERRLQKALKTIEQHLAKSVIDPFNSELCRAFLTKLNFPDQTASNYKVIQTPLPKLGMTRGQLSLPEANGACYNIDKEVGRGSYGYVYKATDLSSGAIVALKYQKPPNIWEIYVCDQVFKRIHAPNILSGFMDITNAIIAPNASLMATEFSPYGTLLDINNKIRQATSKVMHESLVMHFAAQICDIVLHLHKAKIIHADLKPDNFLLMHIPSTDLHHPSLRLIDFGCAIDLSLFPEPDKQKFHKVIQTDGFTCVEMQEGRPWSYETDLFCIAGTVHVILFGDYMQIQRHQSTKWEIKQKFPRYLKKHVWTKFFGEILNIKTKSKLPDLREMRDLFNEEASKMDSELQSQIRTLSNLLKRR